MTEGGQSSGRDCVTRPRGRVLGGAFSGAGCAIARHEPDGAKVAGWSRARFSLQGPKIREVDAIQSNLNLLGIIRCAGEGGSYLTP